MALIFFIVFIASCNVGLGQFASESFHQYEAPTFTPPYVLSPPVNILPYSNEIPQQQQQAPPPPVVAKPLSTLPLVLPPPEAVNVPLPTTPTLRHEGFHELHDSSYGVSSNLEDNLRSLSSGNAPVYRNQDYLNEVSYNNDGRAGKYNYEEFRGPRQNSYHDYSQDYRSFQAYNSYQAPTPTPVASYQQGSDIYQRAPSNNYLIPPNLYTLNNYHHSTSFVRQPTSANQQQSVNNYQPSSTNQPVSASNYQSSSANQQSPVNNYQPSDTNQQVFLNNYEPSTTSQPLPLNNYGQPTTSTSVQFPANNYETSESRNQLPSSKYQSSNTKDELSGISQPLNNNQQTNAGDNFKPSYTDKQPTSNNYYLSSPKHQNSGSSYYLQPHSPNHQTTSNDYQDQNHFTNNQAQVPLSYSQLKAIDLIGPLIETIGRSASLYATSQTGDFSSYRSSQQPRVQVEYLGQDKLSAPEGLKATPTEPSNPSSANSNAGSIVEKFQAIDMTDLFNLNGIKSAGKTEEIGEFKEPVNVKDTTSSPYSTKPTTSDTTTTTTTQADTTTTATTETPIFGQRLVPKKPRNKSLFSSDRPSKSYLPPQKN